jgi:DNA-binding NarL/FixJ family response regulator
VNDRLPTVVVADDHAPTRETVVGILTAGGFDVVAEAADADGAVAGAAAHDPDVCLLDISMPGNGIDAARRIASAHPRTTVVMLTVMVGDDQLFDALRAGARGYLVKGTDPDVMVASLRKTLEGEPALSPGISMRIVEHAGAGTTRRVYVPNRGTVHLSPREAEVLDLLRQGLRTNEVARRMFISQVTVRTHVAAICKKLGAADRAEAVALLGT